MKLERYKTSLNIPLSHPGPIHIESNEFTNKQDQMKQRPTRLAGGAKEQINKINREGSNTMLEAQRAHIPISNKKLNHCKASLIERFKQNFSVKAIIFIYLSIIFFE